MGISTEDIKKHIQERMSELRLGKEKYDKRFDLNISVTYSRRGHAFWSHACLCILDELGNLLNLIDEDKPLDKSTK